MRKHDVCDSEQIYLRQLPGGGFVTIEATPERTLLGQRRYRGEVVVERRAQSERRVGHKGLVVARMKAADIGMVFHQLFPVAQSNTVLATKCLAAARQRLPNSGTTT